MWEVCTVHFKTRSSLLLGFSSDYLGTCLLSLVFFHYFITPPLGFTSHSDMTISQFCVHFLGIDYLDCAFITSKGRETLRTRNITRKHRSLLSRSCCTHIVFFHNRKCLLWKRLERITRVQYYLYTITFSWSKIYKRVSF